MPGKQGEGEKEAKSFLKEDWDEGIDGGREDLLTLPIGSPREAWERQLISAKRHTYLNPQDCLLQGQRCSIAPLAFPYQHVAVIPSARKSSA